MVPARVTQACIFDMDGVLVDSGASHRAAWAALLDEMGERPRQPDFWRLTIGRPTEEALPLVLGRRVPAHEAWELARRKRDLYMELAWRGLPAVAGVSAFVADLVRGGVPRAVGTSAGRYDVDRVLGAIGLRRHFQVVVTADDVTLGKPDPEVYLLAARRLGAPPASCVVFEDSLVGVEAARRASMRAIGVATSHTKAELSGAGAERVVDDFEGLEWTSLDR